MKQSKRTHKKAKYSPRKRLLIIVEIVAALIVIGFLIVKIRDYQTLKSGASIHTASLFIAPNQLTLPPDGIFHIFASTDSGVAFSQIAMRFDRNLLKLSQEITLVNPSLTRVIKKTTMAEANNTGEIVIVLGLDPAFRNSPPSGNFEIASLKFVPGTTNNSTADLAFLNSSSLMVGIDQGPFTITSTGTKLVLNPTPSPSPSSTPTATPPPTSTPRPSPTATPAPVSDTTPPTLDITYPAAGALLSKGDRINIQANATDAGSGINKVDFYVNNPLRCSDTTSPYVCSIKVGPKGSYILRVIATDKSGNITNKTITVTSK